MANTLELIGIREHKVSNNRERYQSRHEKARKYWIESQCTGTLLGQLFGVSFSTGCKWIREWKDARYYDGYDL